MSVIQINKNGEETSFSKPMKRALLRDKRLSFYARGLFAMLWDFPKDWVFYKSYLVAMSPEGKFKLERHIKELKSFGALTIEPKQLSLEEAAEKTNLSEKSYRAGQFSGFKWTLNHPDMWAVEAPLSNKNNVTNANNKPPPKCQFTSIRQNRSSIKSTVGKPATKVLQLEVLANKELLQPPHASEAKKTDEANGRSSHYIFPKQLTIKEQILATNHLDLIELKLAQEVLDELAARLNANKVTGEPLSYLRSLVNRAKTGQFTPEAGVRVALVRQKLQSQLNHKTSSVIKPSDQSEIPKRIAAMHHVLGRKLPSDSIQQD